jgi:hypothetical protein
VPKGFNTKIFTNLNIHKDARRISMRTYVHFYLFISEAVATYIKLFYYCFYSHLIIIISLIKICIAYN